MCIWYIAFFFQDSVTSDSTWPADGSEANTEDIVTSSNPHQILEFFEMCCSLITTLAK